MSSSGLCEDSKGSHIVKTIVWTEELENSKDPVAWVTIVEEGSLGKVLKLEHKKSGPLTTTLLTINNPSINQRSFVLKGKVRYENVEGSGYMEMLSHFAGPQAGAYFSRTLAETGPMAKLHGTSTWRDLAIPFFITDPQFPSPDQITFSVRLEGPGTVWVSDLQLVEQPIPSSMLLAGARNHEASSGSAGPTRNASNKRIASVSWTELQSAGLLPTQAQLVDDEVHGQVLEVVRSASSAKPLELAELKNPGIQSRAYVLTGKVRYENVSQPGYLEMWNLFPPPREGAYFSRTLAETGPMGKLIGTSDWREFQLPFYITDASFPSPSALKINLILPDTGKVRLTDLKLEELDSSSLASLSPADAFRRYWFVWMIGFILLSIAVLFGISLFNRLRFHRESELRRMRALDIG